MINRKGEIGEWGRHPMGSATSQERKGVEKLLSCLID
jgi:hypothetical protein